MRWTLEMLKRHLWLHGSALGEGNTRRNSKDDDIMDGRREVSLDSLDKEKGSELLGG